MRRSSGMNYSWRILFLLYNPHYLFPEISYWINSFLNNISILQKDTLSFLIRASTIDARDMRMISSAGIAHII
jgi:hypothetical protein